MPGFEPAIQISFAQGIASARADELEIFLQFLL